MSAKPSMLKSVLRHAPLYFLGSLFSAGLSTVMTKYYTYIFTPADYGVMAMYTIIMQYLTTAIALNMDGSSTRFYFDYRITHRDEYLSSIFWFLAGTSFVVLILGLVLMPFIVPLIARGTELMFLIVLVASIVKVFNSFLTRILYNEQRSFSVFKNVVLQESTNHAGSVYFISVQSLGLIGRQLGAFVAAVINIFYLFWEFSRANLFTLKRKFNLKMVKETFLLSIPSVIDSMQSVALVYLDRIFLKIYHGNAEVGVYTLGYVMGKGLSMVFEAVSMVVSPKALRDLTENYETGKKELEGFAFQYYAGLLLITLVISLCSPWIIRLVANKNYMGASLVLPFVMTGFMMGGFYKIPSSMLGFHKVVWFYPILSLFSFGTNALLNVFLIPKYSLIGAAYASFVGLFLYSTVLQFLSFKYHSRPYKLAVGILYGVVFIGMTALFWVQL